jgi:predicted RNA-binding protein YlxR (DUF448 family)
VLVRDDRAIHGGRGVYVCRSAECFERARARGAFRRGARVGDLPLRADDALGESLMTGEW